MHCLPDGFHVLFNVVFRHIPKECTFENVLRFVMAGLIRYRRFWNHDKELAGFEEVAYEWLFPCGLGIGPFLPLVIRDGLKWHMLARQAIRIYGYWLKLADISFRELFNLTNWWFWGAQHRKSEARIIVLSCWRCWHLELGGDVSAWFAGVGNEFGCHVFIKVLFLRYRQANGFALSIQ